MTSELELLMAELSKHERAMIRKKPDTNKNSAQILNEQKEHGIAGLALLEHYHAKWTNFTHIYSPRW